MLVTLSLLDYDYEHDSDYEQSQLTRRCKIRR